MIVLISILAAIAWLIKDCIKAKSFLPTIKANWKKYVGCAGAALVYGLLATLKFFQLLSIIAVVYLIGNFFNEVLNFFVAVYGWIKSKVK